MQPPRSYDSRTFCLQCPTVVQTKAALRESTHGNVRDTGMSGQRTEYDGLGTLVS